MRWVLRLGLFASVLGCRTAGAPTAPQPVAPAAAPAAASERAVKLAACSAAPRVELQRRFDALRDFAVAPDGQRVALEFSARTVLLDVASGQQVASVPGGPAVFSHDGSALIVGRYDRLVRWSLPELQAVGNYVAPGFKAGWSRLARDGERVIAHEGDGLHVWEAASRRHVCSAKDGPEVLVLGDGGAWGCRARELQAWDLAACRVTRKLALPDECLDVALMPDGKRVLVSTMAGLRAVEVAAGTVVAEVPAMPNNVFTLGTLARAGALLAERPRLSFLGMLSGLAVVDGGAVAVTRLRDEDDKAPPRWSPLQVWSLAGEAAPRTLGAPERLVRPYRFAADGQSFVGELGKVTGLFRSDGKPLLLLEHTYAMHTTFSGDGARFFVVVGERLGVIDAHTGEQIAVYDSTPLGLPTPGSFVASNRGGLVFYGDSYGKERRHQLLDARDGKITTLPQYGVKAEDEWVSAAFSPDDAWLLTAVRDEPVTLWDTRKKAAVRRLGSGWFSLAPFSADGRRVVIHEKDEAVVYAVPSGKRVARVRGFAKIALTPDGEALLARRADGSVAVVKMAGGKVSTTLPVSGALEIGVDRAGHAVVETVDEVTTWSLPAGERLTTHAVPYELEHVTLPGGRRLASDGQTLEVYGPDGSLTETFAMVERGENISLVVWRPNGTWSGADGVLGFADGLTPCDGTARKDPEMWRATLAGGL